MVRRLSAGGRWIRTIGSAPQQALCRARDGRPSRGSCLRVLGRQCAAKHSAAKRQAAFVDTSNVPAGERDRHRPLPRRPHAAHAQVATRSEQVLSSMNPRLTRSAPPHSITCSAIARTAGEMVRPSALAVSAQPEPQTAFLRSPADIGRGRGFPRGMGALGGPPGDPMRPHGQSQNPGRADLFSRSGLTGQIDLPEHAAAAFREELQTGATKLNVKVGHFMVATIFGTRPPDGVTPIGDERVRGRLGEPPPLSAADYPARDLALPSLHPELPRRGGSARRARARPLLRNGAALGA